MVLIAKNSENDFKFAKYYSASFPVAAGDGGIAALSAADIQKSVFEGAKRASLVPYEPRKQPDGMKSQYEPIGSSATIDTSSTKQTMPLASSKKRSRPDGGEETSKSSSSKKKKKEKSS